MAAGIGSDHECTTVEEAAEKLARGLYILIREATNAHNLETLLPLVTPANSRRCCFCTDDRQPADLLDQGGIDFMVRTAIAYGIDPVTAIQMATLNTAEWFGLHDRGAMAPGRRADLIVFDRLDDLRPRLVFVGGQAGGRRTAPCWRRRRRPSPSPLPNSIHVAWEQVDLAIPAAGRRVRVIGAIENQLVTEHLVLEATIRDGLAVADVSRDLLKMAVIERHHATRQRGQGLHQEHRPAGAARWPRRWPTTITTSSWSARTTPACWRRRGPWRPWAAGWPWPTASRCWPGWPCPSPA